jgi:teichuronic acid biosynthesis glycosyltransferase TuaC
MRVIYIRSGNKGVDVLSTRQGESLSKTGVEIYYFDIVGKGISGYLKNIRKLRNYVKMIDPDILHAHYSLSGFISSISFTGKPVITSLMGSDVLESSPFFLLIVRFFIRLFWFLTIVKTPEMKARLKAKNVEVIPNGVDMELFFPYDKNEARRYLGWDLNSKHILFGSDPCRPEKNYALAEKALKIINDECRHGAPVIHSLIEINPDEVVWHYCASDVLLITSFHEGSSNAIKEAMACNCPIVSTNVGDAGEVINGTEGCVITSFEPADYAAGIEKVFEFDKRTNGREKIAHLDSKKIAGRISAIYREMLKP